MNITFEDLVKANETIITTDIKGTDYAQVHQRVKAFRMLHTNGCIKTEIVSHEDDVIVMRASAYDSLGNLLATGTAFETKDAGFINKTSYIENCETSAVGRCLGFAGFGIDVAIRSAEEQENAEIQQEILKTEDIAKQKINEVKVKALEQRCKADKVDVAVICDLYKVKSLEELTEKKFQNIHEHWEKIKAK